MPTHAPESLPEQLAARGSGVHAVLLYGATGTGVSEAGRAVARQWLCPNAGESGACGSCPVCRSLESGRCVDLLTVAPSGASRIIKNEAVVGGPQYEGVPIVEFVRTGPLMSRNKVVLIEDADRMNSASANALLKTLEEPSARLKLVLTTTAISAILPTIVSRCVAIPCALPSCDALTQEFGSILPFEQVFSEGCPGQLRRIREQADAYRSLWELFESIPELSAGSALWAAERLRSCADMLKSESFGGARGANAEAIRLLAVWLARQSPMRPDLVAAAVEAHRRVLGNASMGAQSDSLFCQVVR